MATINVTLPSDGQQADAADYNTPITTIVNEINGSLDNANIKSNAAISGSKIADASIDLGLKASSWDGWVAVSDSWAYASATTITVPTDATTKYSVGDKIRLVQSGSTKYFYVTAVTSTVLTVNGGSDYTVANSAISAIYYSKDETPLGFPQYFNYTPTFANFTVGSATVVGEFNMVGKMVNYRIGVTLNSSTMGSSPTFTLPVASVALSTDDIIGFIGILDSGTDDIQGRARWATTTTGTLNVDNAAGTYVSLSAFTSTVPMTWANNDIFTVNGTYKAA